MKCVALLVLVIFVQLLFDWEGDPFKNLYAEESNDLAEKTAAYEQYRSTLNGTHGILIPNELVLTVPLKDVSANLVTFFRGFQQKLSDLSDSKSKILDLLAVIQVFDVKNANVTKALNEAVFALAMSVQVLIISTGIVAESATSKLGTIATEAKEAVVSIALILQSIVVVVQSVGTSIASMVASRGLPSTSSLLSSFLLVIDRTLPSVTSVFGTITSTSVVSSASAVVSSLYVTLTALIARLNDSITKLQTSVVFDVTNDLEHILFNLIGAEADFVKYVTSSTATISSSIVAISSSDAGVQSKVARQLQTVFQTLLPLTGSVSDIAVTLSKSLPTLLDVYKTVSTSLVYCIGSELTGAILQAIEDIFASLEKLNKLVVGVGEITDTVIDEIAEECAKNVQIFGSIVMGMTETISTSIGSVNAAAAEAVITLPILHSTVLYVAEWVTVVASPILAAKGIENELVPSLAVTIVAILRHEASIVELIADTVSRIVKDVVAIISSPVENLLKTNTQLQQLSKVNAKTSVRIEQMKSGGSDVAINGIKKSAKGNLSDILSGLTGSSSTISLVFSSSLNSLKNSFKETSASKFEILREVSDGFLSIATDLSAITGSATQVLDLTSKALFSVFGRLLEIVSKLSKLGDLVASLSTTIGNISTALHSLIHAVINYKATTCFLSDSFRELAKTIQIILSTFSAIFTSAADVDSDILNTVSVEIAALPYVVSTIILSIQHVAGAAIPIVSATTGTIHSVQHEFTVAVSSILEKVTSITAETTAIVVDGNVEQLPRNILGYVSNANNLTASMLSKISGVLANIQVTLGKANQ